MTDPNPLALAYARAYPGELAGFLVGHQAAAVPEIVAGLPGAEAAALVARLPQGHAERVLSVSDEADISGWLDAASLDDGVAVALRVPDGRRSAVLDAMDNSRAREAIRRVLVYPVTTVGALTDPSAVHLRADMPLSEAIVALRDDRRGTERAVWLVDDKGCFAGQLDLQQALVAHSDRQPLSDWCIGLRPLRAESTLAAARDVPEWMKHAELPVVDHQERLLGTVSRERLVQALGGAMADSPGLMEDVGDLVRQYFNVMGTVLGDLFSLRGGKR